MIYHALVRFFSEEDGGRKKPPMNGYHPQIKLGDVFTTCSVAPINAEREVFSFGEEHAVTITLMFDCHAPNAFQVGSHIELYEGSKLVGAGVIVQDVDVIDKAP